jgi:hypothetical protein
MQKRVWVIAEMSSTTVRSRPGRVELWVDLAGNVLEVLFGIVELFSDGFEPVLPLGLEGIKLGFQMLLGLMELAIGFIKLTDQFIGNA